MVTSMGVTINPAGMGLYFLLECILAVLGQHLDHLVGAVVAEGELDEMAHQANALGELVCVAGGPKQE